MHEVVDGARYHRGGCGVWVFPESRASAQESPKHAASSNAAIGAGSIEDDVVVSPAAQGCAAHPGIQRQNMVDLHERELRSVAGADARPAPGSPPVCAGHAEGCRIRNRDGKFPHGEAEVTLLPVRHDKVLLFPVRSDHMGVTYIFDASGRTLKKRIYNR
ncbi:hypothetical protein [Oleiagrimonas soli]|uniref:Uncharacterized protein n=1 Tax=Oleiagrimonas soli TaxID=1543381 RepID=A0A841KTV2_9GAMM|nr:hypothetical protein [Oleiagrimonas soli]MBB6185368.1 hypothetical protein [Oleiagrimonas soli]